jgi:isoleucyl-tRNA synthetase
VRDTTDAYERYWTPGVVSAFESFVDDLSNWYIRRSRRRFWEGDRVALRVLWDALTTAIQVISPVMPFIAEHLWRNLVSRDESVFLAPWPEESEVDDTLLAEVAEVRRVVELGRQARAASGLTLRQPLRRLVVAGAEPARTHADEIAEELRVKDVEWGEVDASELRVKPNLRILGPKLGAALRDVRAALQEGRFDVLDDGTFRVDGHVLGPDEVFVERVGREGWAVASDDGLTVALDTTLDDELRLERRVLDVIHQVNAMRRDAGLELTDRIRLWIPDEELLAYEERIREDTLAVSVEPGELRLEKA